MFGGDSTLQIIIKAVDQATGVFKSVQQGLNQTQRSFADTASASQKFAVGLAAGATAIGGLGYVALKAASDMDQTRVAFTTMLGSAEKANAFVQQLVQFAKSTPFTLQGLSDAAKQLLAYGISQKEILPDLKALGDIAAGVGMDKLPFLILAFGQVSAKSKLTGQELKQFADAGVPLREMLAHDLGISLAKFSDDLDKGNLNVTFDQVRNSIFKLTAEGGRFHNLMDAQSHTLKGLLSNTQDALYIFANTFAQQTGLYEAAKQAVFAFNRALANVAPTVLAATAWITQHKEILVVLGGVLLGALIPAVVAAVAAFGSLLATLAPFMAAGGALAAFIEGVREGNPLLLGIAAGITVTLVPALIMIATTVWATVLPAFAALAVAAAPWFVGGLIVGGIVAGAVWVVKNWNQLTASIIKIWENVKTKFAAVWDAIRQKAVSSFQEIKQAVATAMAWTHDHILVSIEDAYEKWKAVWGKIKNAVSNIDWGSLGKNIVDGFGKVYIGLWAYVFDTWIGWFDAIAGFFTETYQQTADGLTKWLKSLQSWFESLPERVSAWLSGVADSIAAWFESLPTRIAAWLSGTGTAIGDWFTTTGTAFSEGFSSWLDNMQAWFSGLPARFTAWFEAVTSAIVEWFRSLSTGSAGDAAAESVPDILSRMTTSLDKSKLETIGKWALIIGAVIVSLPALLVVSISTFILDMTLKMVEAIIVSAPKLQQALVASFVSAFDAVVGKVREATNFLIDLAENWANSWVDAVNVIIRALNKIHFSLPGWLPGIGGKSFGIDIAQAQHVSIPRLEMGGIIPGPVGSAVPIIAHGQETILPVGGARSSGNTYQVIINNPQVRSRSDVDLLRREIDAALRDVTRGHKLAVI